MRESRIDGMVFLPHHSTGECEFELYKDGSIRGSANAKRLVNFFEAAKVKFE